MIERSTLERGKSSTNEAIRKVCLQVESNVAESFSQSSTSMFLFDSRLFPPQTD